MVFFNYTTMQVSAKIVYYGPGLCGKTTNLQQIHGRTDPGSRGEMVSLETEADRTLFFDLLPLEVGTIGGMRVRLQLYTVPGQVFYNTTRKLVLKGVDGIVFVADSQEPMLDANVESLQNLKKNLDELNQALGTVPFVFQYNKRDLRNILSVERLNRHLNREGFEVYEGAALHGVGVFETLKAISRKTLAAVHRKISGEEEPPRRRAAAPVELSRESPDRAAEQAVSTPAAPGERGGNPLFAELERELDPEALAITDERGVGASETQEAAATGELEASEGSSIVEPLPVDPALDPEARARTAEVKVEFAANPSVPQDTQAEVGPVPKVVTQSKLDIERELVRLREIAYGTGRPKRSESSPSTVRLAGKATAPVPPEVLQRATGLVVDVKLIAEGLSHTLPGVVRVELPPHAPGDGARVTLEIDLREEGD